MSATRRRGCAVPGCVGSLKARGMCAMHYYRWYRTGSPGQVGSTYGTPGCSVSGCPNPHRARGYCASHYKTEYDSTVCFQRDCTNRRWARGLCNTHYQSLRSRGLLTVDTGPSPGRNEAIRRAVRDGIPVSQVAGAFNLTRQRIYQILAS